MGIFRKKGKNSKNAPDIQQENQTPEEVIESNADEIKTEVIQMTGDSLQAGFMPDAIQIEKPKQVSQIRSVEKIEKKAELDEQSRDFEIPELHPIKTFRWNWKLTGKIFLSLILAVLFSLIVLAARDKLNKIQKTNEDLFKIQKSNQELLTKLENNNKSASQKMLDLNGKLKNIEDKVGSVTEEQDKLKTEINTKAQIGSWQVFNNPSFNYGINYPSTWTYTEKLINEYARNYVEFKLVNDKDYVSVIASKRNWTQTLEVNKITKKGSDYYLNDKKLATKTVANTTGIVKPISSTVDVFLFQVNGKVYEIERGTNQSLFDEMLATFKVI